MMFYRKNLKFMLFRIVGHSLYFSGVYFLLDRLFENKGVYILMYHRIAESKDTFYNQDIAVKKESFIKQIEYFKSKYFFASMSEAISIMSSKSVLDKDYMVFTFDDGFADNLTCGLDIFRKYGIKPIIYVSVSNITSGEPLWTELVDSYLLKSLGRPLDISINNVNIKGDLSSDNIFVLSENIKAVLKELPIREIRAHLECIKHSLQITGHSFKSQLLTWDDIIRLAHCDIEIGSHTLNHANLAAEPADIMEHEIKESRKIIEFTINSNAEHFAYPFGKTRHYNTKCIESISKLYKSAVTAEDGINKCGDDLYQLKRIMIPNHYSLIDIKIKLLMLKLKNYFKKQQG